MTALATANNLPRDPGQPLDLDTLNAVFENQQPTQVVEWAARQFGDGLVMSSSFGAEPRLLSHLQPASPRRVASFSWTPATSSPRRTLFWSSCAGGSI